MVAPMEGAEIHDCSTFYNITTQLIDGTLLDKKNSKSDKNNS